jgi:soluble lytic murein transglycosylase
MGMRPVARRLALRLAAALALVGTLADGSAALALDAAGRDKAVKAIAAAQAGQHHWAAAIAREAEEPLLRIYLDWLRLRDGSTKPSFASYRGFLAAHPDWPATAQLQARAEDAIDDTVPHAARLAFFADRAPRTRQGRIRLVEALRAEGRDKEALALLRRSWVGDDFSKSEEQHVLGLYGDRLSRADHLARLDRLLWDGAAEAARRMFPLVDPDSRALATARIMLRASAPGVDGAVARVPAAHRGDPGLAYERVRWRRSKGLDAEARAILLDPPAELVRADLWWNERSIQARRALAAKDYRSAYRLAAGHGIAEGADLAEAEWLAGWLALRFTGKPAAALGHFKRMAQHVRMPISQARAAYWAGRAAMVLDREDEAKRWLTAASAFPTTYYGQLAAVELGLQLEARPAATMVAAHRPALAGTEPARVARLLCELGEFSRAVPFVTKLANDAAEDAAASAFVLDLARGCGRADVPVRAAKGVTRDGEPDLRASHPVPRIKGLTTEAAGLPDPALRLAIARQESQFDPTAASPAGARGIMQLMPATARAVAGDLGLPYAQSRLTGDPEYNARLGSTYLQRQIARFDGELALALAAYNAGPMRVATWLRDIGDPRRGDAYGLIDWIELIPFAETRNYVQRVLEGQIVYDIVLREQAASRISAVPRGGRRDARGEGAPAERRS